MKEIDLTLGSDGEIEVSFGGELNGVCCGAEAILVNRALAQVGIELRPSGLFCHLPILSRQQAKVEKLCLESRQPEEELR